MEIYFPPQILLILLFGGALIFCGSRQWVLPTILSLTVFVSMQFHFLVFGLNLFTARILLLIAWVRVLARGEHYGLRAHPLDRAVLFFCASMVLVETLRRGWPGFVYSVANSCYDTLGYYFLGRILLRDGEDIKRVIKSLAMICSAVSCFMLMEALTGHNLLTFLGASSGQVQERLGRMRCQAVFSHPVLAGTYGAVLLPVFAALWWQGRPMKRVAVAGCLASTIMMVTAGSSGPIMTYAAGLFGLFMWRWRHQMRLVRWGVLLSVVSLHLVMKAPVWALIGRVGSVFGGSGYHRYSLLDEFIRHTGDWWLMGIDSTEDWGWLMEDVANTYCIVAKHGGLLALILFIRVLVVAFREVGIRRTEAETDHPTEIMIWAFGACLFSHVVSFLGTSYFDQTAVLWYVTLAMLGSLHLLPSVQPEPCSATSRVQAPRDDRVDGACGISWVRSSTVWIRPAR